MRIRYVSLIVVLITLFSVVTASAGDPDSSNPPDSTSSYTLEDIYNRLDTGAEATKSTFTEPTTGPGTGTMHTLDEIYELIGERAPVPKTGQTTSYDTGDDGDLERGVTWPNPRFTDNGNGTVTDNLTGLIWLKNANCLGGTRNWGDALTFANSLYDGWTGDPGGGDCGLSDGSSAGDWRLPNAGELHSLVHYGYSSPALPNTAGTGQWTEGNPFTGVQSDYYWSSTTVALDAASAWSVQMDDGTVAANDQVFMLYVWPVRGGQ